MTAPFARKVRRQETLSPEKRPVTACVDLVYILRIGNTSLREDHTMSMRMNIVLSDELSKKLDMIAAQQESNKSEVLRKALQLYLAAREGTQSGLKLGLVDPESKEIRTEIVGL